MLWGNQCPQPDLLTLPSLGSVLPKKIVMECFTEASKGSGTASGGALQVDDADGQTGDGPHYFKYIFSYVLHAHRRLDVLD